MNNHLDHDLGERLREFRRQRGFSQQALGERAGLSQRKMSDLEAGKRQPFLLPSQLVGLATELNLDIQEFLGLPAPASERVAARLGTLARLAENLTDDDIHTLTAVAEQLSIARRAREAAPSEDDASNRASDNEGEANGSTRHEGAEYRHASAARSR